MLLRVVYLPDFKKYFIWDWKLSPNYSFPITIAKKIKVALKVSLLSVKMSIFKKFKQLSKLL